VTSCLSVTVVLGLLIALLVEMIIRYRAIRRYVGYGVAFGLLMLVLNALAMVLMPQLLRPRFLLVAIPAAAVGFLATTVWTSMGMYCCAATDRPDFPLLKRVLGRPADRLRGGLTGGVIAASAIVVGAVAFSWLLFSATSPRMSETVRSLTQSSETAPGAGAVNQAAILVIVVTLAIGEELLFRLAMQNYVALRFGLQGRKYMLAILITTVIWTLGHSGVLEPEWVKLVQIFPLGLALGLLGRRYGVEACILAHGAFNVVLSLVGSEWILP
jgi:membrane protease YdiL (CAAX protease family)